MFVRENNNGMTGKKPKDMNNKQKTRNESKKMKSPRNNNQGTRQFTLEKSL